MLYFPSCCLSGVRANRVTSIKQYRRARLRRLRRHLPQDKRPSSVPTSPSKFPASTRPGSANTTSTPSVRIPKAASLICTGHVVIELADATFKADEAEYDENTTCLQSARQRLLPQLQPRRSHLLRLGRVQHRHPGRNVSSRARLHEDQSSGAPRSAHHPGALLLRGRLGRENRRQVSAPRRHHHRLRHSQSLVDAAQPAVRHHSGRPRHHAQRNLSPARHAAISTSRTSTKRLRRSRARAAILAPEAGHSSQFGYFFGAGYYWAINRSYDLTYLFTDYTARGIRQHLDIRGKPTQKTDFNIIALGVDDHGTPDGAQAAPGASVTGRGKDRVRRWLDRARQPRLPELLSVPPDLFRFVQRSVYSSTNSAAFCHETVRLLYLRHDCFAQSGLPEHDAWATPSRSANSPSSNSRGATSRLRPAPCRSGFLSTPASASTIGSSRTPAPTRRLIIKRASSPPAAISSPRSTRRFTGGVSASCPASRCTKRFTDRPDQPQHSRSPPC